MKTIEATGFILMVTAFILMSAAYFQIRNEMKCIDGATSTGSITVETIKWCKDTF